MVTDSDEAAASKQYSPSALLVQVNSFPKVNAAGAT
jgi:hypothetical protein